MNTADHMLSSDHVSSPHIERELKMLQTRWTAFHNQVVESRRLIDLSIEYFQLVEEVRFIPQYMNMAYNCVFCSSISEHLPTIHM